MSTTITVRIGTSLRRRLERRAADGGRALSDVVREILEDALTEQPLGERIGELKGRLRLSGTRSGTWRERIRSRNWRS